MDQYGVYINKSIAVMNDEFVPLSIYVTPSTKSCPIGSGSRHVYWVAGDGIKSMLYLTMGWPVVVSNRDFAITGVYGAIKTMALDGRVKYQLPGFDMWYDLGPITPGGYDAELDSPLETVRRSYLAEQSQQSDLILTELSEAKKSGELDDLFSMGGEFE